MPGSIQITLSGLTNGPSDVGVLGTDPRDMAEACARVLAGAVRGEYVDDTGMFALNYSGDDAAKASATATLVSVTATDSITINGAEFAAVEADPTGDQWVLDADDTVSAANLAVAINASTTAKVAGYVSASVDSNVVTITAVQAGVAGNMFTLIDTGTTITVTGDGFLAGGTGADVSASFCLGGLAAI